MFSLLLLPPLIESIQRVFSVFKITTNRPISIFFKFSNAIVCSLVFTFCNHINYNTLYGKYYNNYNPELFKLEAILSFLQIFIFYKNQLLPSSYLHPGSFANKYIKLTEYNQNQTNSDRIKIQKYGKKYGCHTCGTKLSYLSKLLLYTNKHVVNYNNIFIGDHSPPKALVDKIYLNNTLIKNNNLTTITSKLYPQCNTCSLKQSTNVKFLVKYFENEPKSSKFKKPFKIVKDCKTHGLNHWYFVMPWSFIVNFVVEFYF